MNRKIVVGVLATTALSVALVGARSADADVYFAHACNATVGITNIGAWQRWPPAPNPQAAGTWGNGLNSNRCTATGAGLEVSFQWNSFVPFGVTGNWLFEAPDGASVTGISAAVRKWAQPADGMRPEFWIPSTGETLLGDSTFASVAYQRVAVGYAPMSAKHVAFGYRCRLAQGCFSGGGTGVVMADGITVSVSDHIRPTIVARRPPPAEWIASGVVPLVFDAEDNVGIQQLSISVDGTPIANAMAPCYDPTTNTAARPCAGANQTSHAEVPVSSLSSGEHVVTVTARDVGDSTTVLESRIRVDREAPGAPRRLTAVGGDGWRHANQVAISWVNPPDAGAPIAGRRV